MYLWSNIDGDVYLSVMTIVSSVRQMVETPIYAINEGTSPILSYNYGAQRPKKVKKAIRVLTCMILIYTAITWSVIIFAPDFITFGVNVTRLKDTMQLQQRSMYSQD